MLDFGYYDGKTAIIETAVGMTGKDYMKQLGKNPIEFALIRKLVDNIVRHYKLLISI